MPLNADTLLSSSFKLNDGIGLIGGKSVQQMGIDPGTGEVCMRHVVSVIDQFVHQF
jgi:hypothetical protein